MKIASALLLLLTSTPALASSFDGVWQGVGNTGTRLRFSIEGNDVRQYTEQDGTFVLDVDCITLIDRIGREAFITFPTCGSDGGPVQVTDGYLLSRKDARTLHVEWARAKGNGLPKAGYRRDMGDWIRVKDRQ